MHNHSKPAKLSKVYKFAVFVKPFTHHRKETLLLLRLVKEQPPVIKIIYNLYVQKRINCFPICYISISFLKPQACKNHISLHCGHCFIDYTHSIEYQGIILCDF